MSSQSEDAEQFVTEYLWLRWLWDWRQCRSFKPQHLERKRLSSGWSSVLIARGGTRYRATGSYDNETSWDVLSSLRAVSFKCGVKKQVYKVHAKWHPSMMSPTGLAYRLTKSCQESEVTIYGQGGGARILLVNCTNDMSIVLFVRPPVQRIK